MLSPGCESPPKLQDTNRLNDVVCGRDTHRLIAVETFQGNGVQFEISDRFNREGSTVMSGEIVRFLEGHLKK